LLDIVRFEGDGSFCTGFDALGFSTTEVTHIHNFIKDLYRPDRTGFLTHPTRYTQRRRDENLALLAQAQSILRAVQTITFFTLNAHNRRVQSRLIKIQDFYPREMVVDPSCVDK
jgi:hypothetical protein